MKNKKNYKKLWEELKEQIEIDLSMNKIENKINGNKEQIIIILETILNDMENIEEKYKKESE